jgi:hypothetical protein
MFGKVIYGLAYPGPRGAQRHRAIGGPARKPAAQRLSIFLEEPDPGSRSGFAAACPGNETGNVIYGETSSMIDPARNAKIDNVIVTLQHPTEPPQKMPSIRCAPATRS